MKWRDVPWPFRWWPRRWYPYGSWRFECNRQDLWVGVYWEHRPHVPRLDVWVCLLPMLPLHVRLDDVPF